MIGNGFNGVLHPNYSLLNKKKDISHWSVGDVLASTLAVVRLAEDGPESEVDVRQVLARVQRDRARVD